MARIAGLVVLVLVALPAAAHTATSPFSATVTASSFGAASDACRNMETYEGTIPAQGVHGTTSSVTGNTAVFVVDKLVREMTYDAMADVCMIHQEARGRVLHTMAGVAAFEWKAMAVQDVSLAYGVVPTMGCDVWTTVAGFTIQVPVTVSTGVGAARCRAEFPPIPLVDYRYSVWATADPQAPATMFPPPTVYHSAFTLENTVAQPHVDSFVIEL